MRKIYVCNWKIYVYLRLLYARCSLRRDVKCFRSSIYRSIRYIAERRDATLIYPSQDVITLIWRAIVAHRGRIVIKQLKTTTTTMLRSEKSMVRQALFSSLQNRSNHLSDVIRPDLALEADPGRFHPPAEPGILRLIFTHVCAHVGPLSRILEPGVRAKIPPICNATDHHPLFSDDAKSPPQVFPNM